jgi:hypothetical protein
LRQDQGEGAEVAAPTADQITAVFTAIAAIFAGWSARQAGKAAKAAADGAAAAKQGVDAARESADAARDSADAALQGIVAETEAIHATTFTYLESYEREIKMPVKKNTLKLLQSDGSIKERQSDGTVQDVTDQKLQDVLDIINFVNLLAHVARNHYVESPPLLRRHTPIIRDCEKYVVRSGWLDAYREKQNQRVLFINLETLCDEANLQLMWQGRVEDVRWPDPFPGPALAHVAAEPYQTA